MNDRSARVFWIIGTIVVVIGLAFVVALATGSKKSTSKPAAPASAALVAKITAIPASVVARVAGGTAAGAPKPITAPALTAGGKPEILYVGAEYCPYCATERWPMVIALSRFGTFANLHTTHSSSVDVFPSTATFSFHGATYASNWISFAGVETETNQQQGDGYAPLDKLTPAQQQIFATYDAPPYASSSGGIPFIDLGGKFIVEGASYNPAVLGGKTADEIADALRDASNPIAQGAVGTANGFTAAICILTGDQPAKVCSQPAISRIEATLR